MRRPGFQDGTMIPPQKPEQKTPFIDKLKNLRNVAPGLMPRSKVDILKMYMDEALKDGEITQEQHTEMLMPYFGELGEKVTEQIEVSDRENFAEAGLVSRGPNKGKYFIRYRPAPGEERVRKFFDTNEELQTFIKSRPGYVPPKEEILKIAEDLKKELGRLPTQTEVSKKANIAIQTVKSRLEEGKDFAKPLTKLEAAKLGGKKRPDTAVLEVSDDLVKKFKDLKFRHISPSLDTTKAGSKKFRVKFDGPIANDFKDIFVDATEENLPKITNQIDDIATSNLYKNKAKVFKTDEQFRKLRRLKDAMYRKKDPYGVYEKLRRYKADVFPGDFSKEIQIQHGQPKFSTQTLSRFGFIPKDVNVSPAVEMTERIRNEKLATVTQKLKSTTLSTGQKAALIEEFNDTMKGLRGQLKGTPGQGLVNFELLDIDQDGNVTKLKDTGFDPKRGIVASDEDLSKITKERADELIKLGKQKIDSEAVRLKLIPANQLPTPEKTQTRNMFNNANMRLKAELLPGLQDVVEGIKNIPDDIRKKKIFKLGLKALGPIGTYIAVDDTYEALKAGKPVAEALEYGLIGTDIIGSTKDVLALSPEGKEARSVVKQQDMREQITDDFSGLDIDFDTPNVKSEMSRQEAERKYEQAKIARGMERAAEEKALANARAISVDGIKDLITGERFAGQEIPEQFLAVGGRVGFADGPDDPKRRKFMKIAGGIASIPFIGKYFKAAAPVAEKTVEIIRRGADGIPDFIGDLVTKVITFGKKSFSGGRSDELAEVYQLDNYVVTKKGNKTTIREVDQDGDMLYKENQMEIEIDPETKGVTYNEASARPDAEGKLKDVEEYIEESDLENMRKYTYDE
jgi:hypothetical protein